ncbi:hypothetical protein ACP70R_012145 [Stipagrostis hirtigluma subsp. patula]
MERSSFSVAVVVFLALAVAASYSKHSASSADRPAFSMVTLVPPNGDQVPLAVRTGRDLSVIGFANRTHHWHAVSGLGQHSYRNLLGGLSNLVV